MVTEIMSRPVITVTAVTGVKAAARLLVQHGISALPVVDVNCTLVGILSEADLHPMEIRPDRGRQSMPLAPTAGGAPKTVAAAMTRRVLSVPADCEVSRVARILLEADCRRVPVVTDGRVVGIVSRRDLVKVIARRDDMIKSELVRQLGELALGTSPDDIGVDAGVVTIQVNDRGSNRRLAESVALMVSGVMEVRFTNPRGS